MISELFLKDMSLWGCVWQSTLFAVIGLAGSFLLRRRPARACQVLIFAMIAAVLVPTMSVLVKHFELGMFEAEPIARQLETRDMSSATVYGESAVLPTPETQPEVHEGVTDFEGSSGGAGIPWRMIVLYGWMIATLILLGRLLAAFVSGVLLLRRAQSQGCEQIQRDADSARARLGITKGLQVRSSKDIHSPVIWCWCPIPVLLVPGDLDDRVDWEGVVCHELAHWRRWDHISGLIAELIVCILSWNPLLWWSKKRMVRLSEQACDDWVVAGGRPCEDYAQSLLNFKPQKQVAFVPAVVHSRKGLAARVRRILQDSCGTPRTGAVWALAVSIVAACLAIGVACAQTRPAKPEAASEHQNKPTKSLHKAAADGDIEQVKLLISSGADINSKDQFGMTPLYLSLINRLHKDVAELLLDKGANPNTTNKNGATLLHQWAWGGDPAITKSLIEFLVSKGADVNALNYWTPLHSACSQRRGSVAKILIDNGADVNAKDKWDDTPLHCAVWNDDVELAKLLVNNGADFNAKDLDGWTAFRYAVSGGNRGLLDFFVAKGANASDFHTAAWLGDLNRVKSFVEQGTDVNTKDDQLNWTALQWVAFTGKKDVCEFLLAKGADVNVKDEWSSTPLHYAAVTGQRELVELFLSKGAEVNAKCYNGKTPLHDAARNGHREVAELLIAGGADVNAKYLDGRTSLHRAAEKGHREVVKLLVANGADINMRDKSGQTPLQHACSRGQKDTAEFLIAKGADVNSKNQDGRTPLDVAAGRGDKDMAALLITKSANINTKNRWGATPLHIAAKHGYTDVAKFLVAKGADVNAKNNRDLTPLHMAAREGHKEVGEFLIASGADVNAKNQGGRTPLTFAEENGNNEIAELLRKHGAKE